MNRYVISTHAQGTPGWLANLPQLARDRLASAGVAQVTGGAWCTVEEASGFFSFRREPRTASPDPSPVPSPGRAKNPPNPPSASRSRRTITESYVSSAFATRSTSGRGNPSADPTSRTADRARIISGTKSANFPDIVQTMSASALISNDKSA